MPRPPRRKPAKVELVTMPKGLYLKKGIWYKRIRQPYPKTGQWVMLPESTACKESDRQGAIDYVDKRNRELGNVFDLCQTTDPARITMDELFNDVLETLQNEGHTRKLRVRFEVKGSTIFRTSPRAGDQPIGVQRL